MGGVAAAGVGRAEKTDAVIVRGRGGRRRRRISVQQRWTKGPIAGDIGIAARRARRLVANSQSEDDDPRGGDRRAMGAVDALDCSERGRIAVMTRTMTTMTRKQTSASSPTAATTAIARCLSPRSRGSQGRAASHTERVRTTPERGRSAGGIATMTGGSGDDNGDVEVPAVRATGC